MDQFKLQVTELTSGEQGIVETTHTFWYAEPLFGAVRDVIASIPIDQISPRPHPRHHLCKFFHPTEVTEGENWTEEDFHPASPAFEGLLADILPTLQAWENTQSGREHYTYATITIE